MKHSLLLLAIISTIFIYCHKLDVPLHNDTPTILNTSQLERVLYFPDTTVCTLAIEDLNDKSLYLSCHTYDTITPDTILCDTQPWPGHFNQTNQTYDKKHLVLSLPQPDLTTYSGMLCIYDQEQASTTIPYCITKELRDTFNIHSPARNLWHTYRPNDTAHIKPMPILSTYTLQLILNENQICRSTGLRTTYCIAGDFCINVKFGIIGLSFDKLRGIRVSFNISTSPDTIPYSGIDAGLYIGSSFNKLQITAAKGFDLVSKYVNYFSGNMRIAKSDTVVSLYCWDETSIEPLEVMKRVTFSPKDSLFYVHLKMSVDNLDHTRYCLWDNFTISKGSLKFLEEPQHSVNKPSQ